MNDFWNKWCERSRGAALRRWDQQAKPPTVPPRKGSQWEDELRKQLLELQKMEILQPREHMRLQLIDHERAAKSDLDRLDEVVKNRKKLVIIGVAGRGSGDAGSPSDLKRQTLSLVDGQYLQAGRLGLQVFVDDAAPRVLGMNIQLRGHRGARPIYMRYDLDAVQMGSGPVTHFQAHWHVGEDPDSSEAEKVEPRPASLVLDPVAVVDILVETFFPNGPVDVLPPESRDKPPA